MTATLIESVAPAPPPAQVAPRTSRLATIFAPRSVAVVGATATPGTVPHDIFANVLTSGFKGTLYPVAPGKQNICSVKSYRYVLDVPDPVDLAVIVFPAEVVDRALEQCGEKGIRSAIIISAGFREAGAEGARREQRVKEICERYGIGLIGPNCLGVINTDPAVRLNASFARKMPDAGRIGFLSQSGALCTAVLDYARDKHIGFSKFVSFGNRAGVSEVELLEYLHDDPQTDVILLYLEEVSNGRALVDAARRITAGPGAKPVLAIKAGRTADGAAAAASHTGSLAGEDAVCDDAFRAAGIVRVSTIEEMFNAATACAYHPLPAGDRLAIVTNAGGPGVMATDAAVKAGLTVTRFRDQTTRALRAALPCTANLSNPVDVIGDARVDRYRAALEAVLDDPNVDQALVILTPQSMTDIEQIARGVVDIARASPKLVACSLMGAADVADGVRVLQAAHVPHYTLPEHACRALADVQRIRRAQARGEADASEGVRADVDRVRSIIDAAPDGFLREDQALEVLRAYGLPVPPFRLCAGAREAVEFAAHVGYPVALRVVSRDVTHKTEVGGVVLDCDNADAVMRGWDRVQRAVALAAPDARIDGLLVRPMIPRGGTELICGAKRDASFGPVVMFGLGGIYVELFGDVAFALAPPSTTEAGELVRRTKAFRLLEGLRGTPPADVDGVGQCLVRVGRLVADFPRIVELDVNPLIALPQGQGSAVADVRIRLGP